MTTNRRYPIEYQIYAVKCFITRNNSKVHFPKELSMRNWKGEYESIDGIKILRTKSYLVFYLGQRKSIRPDEIDKETRERYVKVIDLANKINEKYGILCNSIQQIPIRKEIKVKIPIDQIEDYIWYSNISKKVYKNEVEFIHPKFAEEHVKNFVNNMAIESYAKQIMESMVKWNDNFEKHYGVLDKTNMTLSEIRKEIKNLADIVGSGSLMKDNLPIVAPLSSRNQDSLLFRIRQFIRKRRGR